MNYECKHWDKCMNGNMLMKVWINKLMWVNEWMLTLR